MKRFIAATLAAVALSGLAGAQRYPGSPAQNLFEQASAYLTAEYFGPSQVPIPDLIARYQVRLDEACQTLQLTCSYEVAEPVLSAMFNELGDAHAGYLPASSVAAEQAAATNQGAPVPRLGLVSNEITPASRDRLVMETLEGGPAERAGVQAGDRWTGVDGEPWPTEAQAWAAFFARFQAKVRSGEPLKLNLVRGAERTPLEVTLKGELFPGRPRVKFTLRPDGVAVIAIKDFFPQGTGVATHDAVAKAIASNAKAIILDLRNNGGGQLTESMIATGAFIDAPLNEVLTPRRNPDIGRLSFNFASGIFRIRNAVNADLLALPVPRSTVWKGALAVLVDGNTTSATERMAYQIQRAKRGTIIGLETTGVNDTDSKRFGLVNGGAAAMPTVRSFNLDGTPFPSSIKPDIVVADMWLTLFNTGRDPGIEAALRTLGVSGVNLSMPPVLPTGSAFTH